MKSPTFSNAILRTAVLLLFPVFCFAQSGLLLHGGSPALGMGGVFVCLPGLSGTFGNPANLARLPGFEADVLYEARFQVEGLNETGVAFGSQLGRGALGASFRQLAANAYREQLFQLSYARPLLASLDIGVRFDGGVIRVDGNGSRFLVNGSIGVRADLSTRVSYGFLVHRPFRLDAFSAGFMPSALIMGIQYLPTGQFRLLVDCTKYALQPVGVRLGLAYLPHPGVQIRAGAGVSPSAFSFGLGIGMKGRYRIQTAVAHHSFLGVSPAFGMHYQGQPQRGIPNSVRE